MKKNLLFISCEEAYHICDKSQYNEASFWEKLKLNLRYTWCKFTRAYVKRNKKLTKIVKNSNVNCLQNAERQHLKQQFEKQLKNHD
ncbi:MAG: hypothetical protein R2812_11140 [Gelidibacter sp.]|nr:hypothetical protein [Gelidibacter sp.]